MLPCSLVHIRQFVAGTNCLHLSVFYRETEAADCSIKMYFLRCDACSF